MWLFTRQEAKNADHRAQESGLLAETLMDRAGFLSAEAIQEEGKKRGLSKQAVILCGFGHNGGDGFVVATKLFNSGWDVTVIAPSTGPFSDLWKKKRGQFKGRVVEISSLGDSNDSPFLKSAIWVDAFFGIGLNRALTMQQNKILAWINRQPGLKFSLDVPSGLDCDTGNLFGQCFRADFTLTIERPKVGFYFNRGSEFCGQIRILQIGFSKEMIAQTAKRAFLLPPALAARWIPTRLATDHKGKGGKCFIWAGSPAMPGAAILAALACSRAGAGYIYVSEEKVLAAFPEAIPMSIRKLAKVQAALIGPGLGVNSHTERAVKKLRSLNLPVVIDADALSAISTNPKAYFPLPSHWIATPHVGELSRVLKISVSEIESNRLLAAEKAQKYFGCVVVLKGFHTVVSVPGFSIVVPTGNVALAKGGSGDVLAGLIVGLLSQQISPDRAALLAVYLHGEMADHWIRSGRDYLSLTPSDLIAQIPFALRRLRAKSDSALR